MRLFSPMRSLEPTGDLLRGPANTWSASMMVGRCFRPREKHAGRPYAGRCWETESSTPANCAASRIKSAKSICNRRAGLPGRREPSSARWQRWNAKRRQSAKALSPSDTSAAVAPSAISTCAFPRMIGERHIRPWRHGMRTSPNVRPWRRRRQEAENGSQDTYRNSGVRNR